MMDDRDLTIRKLGSRDATLARDVVRRFHECRVSDTHLRQTLADEHNLLLVAEVAGELVGFVWAHWLDRLRLERRQLFVYEIEVAPEFRRRGIGTRLMQSVFAEAAAAGSETFLLTERSNEAALAFYRRLGAMTEHGDSVLFRYPAP